MKKTLDMKNIIIYFILTYIISWALWTGSVINSNITTVPNILLLFGQFAILGPGIAAIILIAKEDGKLGVKALFRGAWNWKFKTIWLVPTLLLPLAMILVTLVIKLPIEGKAFSIADVGAPIPIFAVVLFFIGGPLEEFGWRGYALPKLLKKYSFVVAALIVGVLHGLWHLPLHFIDGTVQSAMPFWEFVAVTTVGSVIYAWIFVKTNSNLMLMLAHHWAGNLTAALFVYWDTSLGRWVFFAVQLVVVVVISLSQSKKKQISSNT